MILAQILITSDECEATALPRVVIDNMSSFKSAFPNMQHKLFTESSIRELLRERFDVEVLSAFDSLVPYTYKADLAKYCIMYIYGGVYADIGVRICGTWPHCDLSHNFNELKSGQLFVFPDFREHNPNDVATMLFAVGAGNPALAAAIEMVCENVRNQYYGESPLCPTGPTLFGNAISKTRATSRCIWGESRWLLPPKNLKRLLGRWGLAKLNDFDNLVFSKTHALFFEDKLIGMRIKQGGGSLSELGIRGGNEYPKLWSDRAIYR